MVGIYRLWRDSGYAVGALLAGVMADLLGTAFAIGVVGGLTLLSGIVVAIVMRETRSKRDAASLQEVRYHDPDDKSSVDGRVS
ncbi:MAG TPA: hypothetical protein VKR06_00450 [Ktedonosporobacter sp.]|nr:hypothetical protein [Ktedonosporobacter sp.]